MTDVNLIRAKELDAQIKKENENIQFLRYALDYHIIRRRNPIRKFMMRFTNKDKTSLSLGGEGVSFGSALMVDREFLEYAEKFFIKRRDELKAKFDLL